MQQSETNTLAAALTTMMAGASVLSTLANSDIIEVRNSSGALKGKITAQNLAAFAAGSCLRIIPYSGYTADNIPVGSICYTPNGSAVTFESGFEHAYYRNVYITVGATGYGSSARVLQVCICIPTRSASGHTSDTLLIRGRLLTGTNWGEWIGLE